MRWIIGFGAGLALGLAAGGALAQEEGQMQVQFTGWTTSCTAANRAAAADCVLVQRANLANGQQFIGLTIRVPGETRAPVMLLQLPLGLDLQQGLALSVDGTDTPEPPVQTCEANGCFAGGPLDPALLTAMQAGGNLQISFQNTRGGTISVPVPLTGFTAAYQSIQ